MVGRRRENGRPGERDREKWSRQMRWRKQLTNMVNGVYEEGDETMGSRVTSMKPLSLL